jgi:hypothetical protein
MAQPAGESSLGTRGQYSSLPASPKLHVDYKHLSADISREYAQRLQSLVELNAVHWFPENCQIAIDLVVVQNNGLDDPHKESRIISCRTQGMLEEALQEIDLKTSLVLM